MSFENLSSRFCRHSNWWANAAIVALYCFLLTDFTILGIFVFLFTAAATPYVRATLKDLARLKRRYIFAVLQTAIILPLAINFVALLAILRTPHSPFGIFVHNTAVMVFFHVFVAYIVVCAINGSHLCDSRSRAPQD